MLYKQNTDNDCFLACIACLVERPQTEIWNAEFLAAIEASQGTYNEVLEKAFEIAGLRKNKDYTVEYISGDNFNKNKLKGRRAILQVPSLVFPAPVQHGIYWDGESIHDPSHKNPYKTLDECKIKNIWLFNDGKIKRKLFITRLLTKLKKLLP